MDNNSHSLYRNKRRLGDAFLLFLIYFAAFAALAILIGLLSYILVKGVPHISWTFLSTAYSVSNKALQGILPMIINTLYVVVITLLIAAPVGICSAIYLTQYAKQGRFVRAIRFTTEILAGIPSIVFGLFGYTVFCILFGLGTSILAGCLTMSICILPTIIRSTEEALLAVPVSYQEGAMALGAGKLRVIRGIVLPCAMPGVLTAVILGVGRVVGESAALLFTVGLSYQMPKGVFSHILEGGRTLTLHLYHVAKQATSADAMNTAFATAAVLLIIVFLLNRLAAFCAKALKKG